MNDADLVCGQDAEGVNDLLRGVGIGGFAGHEVQERVKRHEAAVVGINDSEDTLEVNLTLKAKPSQSNRELILLNKYEEIFHLSFPTNTFYRHKFST